MATSPVVPAPAAASAPPTVSSPGVAAPSTLDTSSVLDGLDAGLPNAAGDEPVIITPDPKDPPVADPAAPVVVAKPTAEADEEEYTGELPSPDSEAGEMVTYKKARLARWNAAMKTMHELDNEIPGFTKDMAIEDHTRSVATTQLLEDFHSADPGNIDKFLSFFGEENPHSLGMMAMRLPGLLQQVNAEAYDQLLDGMFGQKLEALYPIAIAEAKRLGVGGDNLLKAIQVIDHHLNGNFKTSDSFKEASPQDERERNLEAREQHLNRQTTTQAVARIRTYETSVVQEVTDARKAEIESGLGAVKDNFKDRPRDWNHLVRDMDDAIAAKIAASPTWKSRVGTIKQRMLTALKTGQTAQANQARASLVAEYKTMYGAVVKANRKQLIEASTARTLEANTQVHDQHKKSAQQTESPAPGAPSGVTKNFDAKALGSLDKIWAATGL